MTPDTGLADGIRHSARAAGFDLVGFARASAFDRERDLILASVGRGFLDGMAWITPDRVRLSCDLEALLPGARSIVALGTAYASKPEAEPDAGRAPLRGRVARYAWGRDYHKVIPPRLRTLTDEICRLGGEGTACRSFVDTGPLVDRAAAERGSLGFIGKNTCVLTGQHGSYVFLSAIITTAEITADPLQTRDCGSCRACLDACPTGALVAPYQLDATRCISYLTIEHRGTIPAELRPHMGDWVFGCDICEEVCPWNRARPQATHREFDSSAGVGSTLDLIELLSLDEAAFRERFRGTALTRPKRAGLLRNAAIALGNLGDRTAVPALVRALTDEEPLVRGHAAWALGQLAPLPDTAIKAMREALAIEMSMEASGEIISALDTAGTQRWKS